MTGKLLATFFGHSKTVTDFIITETNDLYSVSLDGCLKKLNIKVTFSSYTFYPIDEYRKK